MRHLTALAPWFALLVLASAPPATTAGGGQRPEASAAAGGAALHRCPACGTEQDGHAAYCPVCLAFLHPIEREQLGGTRVDLDWSGAEGELPARPRSARVSGGAPRDARRFELAYGPRGLTEVRLDATVPAAASGLRFPGPPGGPAPGAGGVGGVGWSANRWFDPFLWDAPQAWQLTYDASGRRLVEARPLGGGPERLRVGHDASGLVTSITLLSGDQAVYARQMVYGAFGIDSEAVVTPRETYEIRYAWKDGRLAEATFRDPSLRRDGRARFLDPATLAASPAAPPRGPVAAAPIVAAPTAPPPAQRETPPTAPVASATPTPGASPARTPAPGATVVPESTPTPASTPRRPTPTPGDAGFEGGDRGLPAPARTPAGEAPTPVSSPFPQRTPATAPVQARRPGTAPVQASPAGAPALGRTPSLATTPGRPPAQGPTPRAGHTPAAGPTPRQGATPKPGATPAARHTPAQAPTPAQGHTPAPGRTPAAGPTPAPGQTPRSGGGPAAPGAAGAPATGPSPGADRVEPQRPATPISSPTPRAAAGPVGAAPVVPAGGAKGAGSRSGRVAAVAVPIPPVDLPASAAPLSATTPTTPTTPATPPAGTARAGSRLSNEGLEREVATMVESWRAAWVRKDVGAYMRFYSPRFAAESVDRAGYEAHKRNVFTGSGDVRVDVGDVRVSQAGEVIRVSFDQIYTSQQHRDRGRKTLVLERVGDGLRIVRESFEPAR